MIEQILKVPVSCAFEQGHQFLLTNDGEADVVQADGRIFHVENFHCDCGEHVFRNFCQHALWVRQLHPCDKCGSVMEFGEYTTCFGEMIYMFQCPSCGNARDIDVVKEERLLGVHHHRFTPQGRCEQALVWLTVRNSDWYIWQAVYQSPELIPMMIDVLAKANHHTLAESIVNKARYNVA